MTPPEDLVLLTLVFIFSYLVGTACHSYFYERDYDSWFDRVIWVLPVD